MMSNKLVIFGSGDMAELAHYYFSNDTDFTVVAFTVDKDFITESTCCGLPVVAFEELASFYPPEIFYLFIALSYSKLNLVRKERYLSSKVKGYRLASYISSRATVLNNRTIGDNCFILENNTIQPFVTIGNNVTLWSGNHIGHHSTIGDHSFIASHVVISGGVHVGKQCFVGVNATLRDHISLGERCVIGAGVLLLKSVEDECVFIGKSGEKAGISSTKISKI